MKKLYQTFFYIPKRSSVPTRVFQTRTLLSALTMLVCCAVFTSATLAYFTSSQSSGVSKIQSAEFTVDISSSVTDDTIETVEDSSGGVAYKYTCNATTTENVRSITIKPTGTATVGYCKVAYTDPTADEGISTQAEETVERKYVTEEIGKDEVRFTVSATPGTVITFTPCWGHSQAQTTALYDMEDEFDEIELIFDGDKIVFTKTPYVSYYMEENVSLMFYQLLEELEFYYSSGVYEFDVTADDIWAFNGFDALAEELGIEINEETLASDVLQPKDEVKIPYVLEDELDEEMEPFTVAAPDETEELPSEILPMPDGSLPVDPDASADPEDPDQTEQPAEGDDDTAAPDQTGEGEDGQTPETPIVPDGENTGDGQQTGDGEITGTDDGQTDGEAPAAPETGATDSTENAGDSGTNDTNTGSESDAANSDGTDSETDSVPAAPEGEPAPAEETAA